MRLFHGPIAVPPEIVAYPAAAWLSKARVGRSSDLCGARVLTDFPRPTLAVGDTGLEPVTPSLSS